MSIERTSVGLDVHALSVVACAIDNESGQVSRRRLCPDPVEIVGWLTGLAAPVRVAYEAGPTGFGLYRALTAAGIDTVVVAPSKLQRPVGDRVKTDARDALHLARLLRLGEIVAVRVPTVAQEAARDLVRAREDARGDLMRSRHRLSKLLLRQGIVYSGGQAWTGAHEVWLRAQRFDQPPLQTAFGADFEAMLLTKTRRDRLDAAIAELAATSEYTPLVRRRGCLRGISTLTGFALAAEIGDWHRFTGKTIGSYLGLVPTEYSSGSTRSQGSIKTGNGHARRLLVEAAWHHRRTYRNPTTTMSARWALAPAAARARGHAGNHRLHHRWEQFTAHHKRPVIANVAIARELAGWCWSLAVLDG
ncbi:IS110 family transposase [Nocardia sp. NPDC051981]|uniref:IS110 family transposase n=1 Tax=Nocardia sp. NPDC051981 TaxID=3155417 RepID=UPI0034395085